MAGAVEEAGIPQPDFAVISTSLRDMSISFANLATHMGEMTNIPALGNEAQATRGNDPNFDREWKSLHSRIDTM